MGITHRRPLTLELTVLSLLFNGTAGPFGARIAPGDYNRRLSDEPDPRDLLRPFPAEPMRMWPISTRVNKLENDEPSLLDPVISSAA
jgi:hypothetical protein